MTNELFTEYIAKINLKLQEENWKEGKKEIARTLEDCFAEPIECSKSTVEIFLNRLKCLISGYMYCLTKEKNIDCIIQDFSVLQAITSYKAFEKEFEKSNYKTQDWIDTYCGLSIVSQKIYLSQMNELDLDTDTYEDQKNQADLKKLLRKKQLLERMTDVTFIQDKILSDLDRIRIPENALCIEFVCYGDYQIFLENYSEKDFVKTSVLLHEQAKGKICSRWIGELQDGGTIFDQISNLTNLYSVDQKNSHRDLLEKLSGVLLKSVWPYLNGVETIFWIPDNIFFYLPMEMLFCSEGHKQLLDVSQHVYLDSLLDCREEMPINMQHTNALVIGAPSYAMPVDGYNKEEIKNTEKRMAQIHITELVNSRQECEIIGKLFHTAPLMGEQAHKSSFFENCGENEIIHLSTHGEIFNSKLFDKIPSAGTFLVMAGYKNWYVGNYVLSCGNGCLTAQEIAMTDLRKVKLVVISACKSAVSLFGHDGSMVSIRGVFEAAGVEQTVAALWEVEDCATAILMVLFYRYLYSAAPSIALKKAKQKLRKLDYQEIRSDMDLYSIWQDSGKGVIPDHERPYVEEQYWAAFICHINGVR